MAKNPLYTVDVFAEDKYAGNQLAVIGNANNLSSQEMQKIAKEMNYSETTFILSGDKRNGGYDVRIFTPEEELPFAGHPTIGTALIIKNEIIKKDVDKVLLNLGVGQIPVTFDPSGLLWMKQVEPKFGKIINPKIMAELLGISVNDIDSKYPVQIVSTGIPFFIVPLKTLAAVKKIKTDPGLYGELLKEVDFIGILVFSPETYNNDNDLNVRVTTVFSSIPEDPATGSANGCLAGYLVKYKYFGGDKIDVKVEQGYEIGRKSLLYLKSEYTGEKIDVNVGGKVIMVARGELL